MGRWRLSPAAGRGGPERPEPVRAAAAVSPACACRPRGSGSPGVGLAAACAAGRAGRWRLEPGRAGSAGGAVTRGEAPGRSWGMRMWLSAPGSPARGARRPSLPWRAPRGLGWWPGTLTGRCAQMSAPGVGSARSPPTRCPASGRGGVRAGRPSPTCGPLVPSDAAASMTPGTGSETRRRRSFTSSAGRPGRWWCRGRRPIASTSRSTTRPASDGRDSGRRWAAGRKPLSTSRHRAAKRCAARRPSGDPAGGATGRTTGAGVRHRHSWRIEVERQLLGRGPQPHLGGDLVVERRIERRRGTDPDRRTGESGHGTDGCRHRLPPQVKAILRLLSFAFDSDNRPSRRRQPSMPGHPDIKAIA